MHNPFFTSLKQLEKRLKLENHPSPPPLHNSEENIQNTQQTEDLLDTPIYLNENHPAPTPSSHESETPRQFLSNSPDFPHEENYAAVQEPVDNHERRSLDDEIEVLMQLLGLSDSEQPNKMVAHFDSGCEDGFYGRIVGVKGPKSGKEVDRLEGWIKHFMNGEKKEPFRLVHLLLVKAAFVHSGNDSDSSCKGFEFPSTVDEFLQNDPPAYEHLILRKLLQGQYFFHFRSVIRILAGTGHC
ncbi:hypothetical protein ACJIZ3_008350 [Penstemon smallii]|uniref:Uncharacterized protein n=1 Tax=Penstemon smallii TaxID=265156 RepID=A0ABD3T9K9_9LAMI